MTPAATLVHPAAPPEPRLYKIPDAVRLLQLSRSEVFEQIRAGRLRTVKQGRATFITPAALADYIKLLEQEAGATR